MRVRVKEKRKEKEIEEKENYQAKVSQIKDKELVKNKI